MIRAVRWLIVPAGLVLGHGLGYAVAHAAVDHESLTVVSHSHMGAIAGLGVPLALGAAFLMGLAGFRRGPQSVTVATLAARLCLAFFLLELAEHGGSVAVLGEATLWAGLAAQVVVAAAAAWVLRALAAGGHALAALRAATTRPARNVPPDTPRADPVRPEPRTSISGRGPPALTRTV